ncbi:unnamed protein product [Ascophyllum nodosum]
MDHDHGDHSSHMSHGPFCEGEGMVMLNGFQSASGADATCVLFLFQNAVVDTKTKYAIAVIGVFCMAFANEMIRYWRGVMGRGATSKSFTLDLTRTFAFAVQMMIAYFLMLLVMLYEYVFLIMIILGLSVGHLVTLRLAPARKAGQKEQPEGVVGSSGTPCCDNGTACA